MELNQKNNKNANKIDTLDKRIEKIKKSIKEYESKLERKEILEKPQNTSTMSILDKIRVDIPDFVPYGKYFKPEE